MRIWLYVKCDYIWQSSLNNVKTNSNHLYKMKNGCNFVL